MSVKLHKDNYRNQYRKYVPDNCRECNKLITELPFVRRAGDGNYKTRMYCVSCAKRINLI